MLFSDIGHVTQLDSIQVPQSSQVDLKLRTLDFDDFSWTRKDLEPVTSKLDDQKTDTLMKRKTQRLASVAIYQHFLSICQSEKMSKMFRRYLERKIEADSLEEEARTKNVSLNEIEEKRSNNRRLRRKSGKSLEKQPSRKEPKSKGQTRVKYDPKMAGSMQWTMKYAPMGAEDIIGNAGVVKELAQWLRQWQRRQKKDIGKR